MNGKIYMIRNEVNGKRYIGQTVNSLEERFKQHKQGTRQPKKNMTKLQKAMDKYGKPMFTITLIEGNIETIELLAEREKFFIEKFNTKEEYNSTSGGENRLRIKTTIHKNSGLLILHSNFNKEVIPKLNLREQKLFMLLLSKVNCTNTTIEINIDEILEFMDCEYEKPSSIKQLLTSLSIKIDKVKYPFLDEDCNSLQKEKLFTLLLYNSDKEVIQVLLNNNLRYLVNKTRQRGYFSVPLNVIQNIDSRYGQILYRLLSSIKQKRTLTLSRNDLIYLLDCPPSYDIKKFHKLVLEPAMKSISEFFPSLTVEKIKKGKVISNYVFSLDKRKNNT